MTLIPMPEPLVGHEEIVQKATRSIKWVVFTAVIPRFISPIVTVILASILLPADFGVVAIASLVMSLASIVLGLGWGPAVIQRRDQVDEAASSAFWLGLSFSVVLYIALWLLAPLISQLYKNPVVLDVLRVAGVSMVIDNLGSIPNALLQRDLKFRSLFWINAVPSILSNIVSLLWALAGGGLWSLVFGPLFGVLLSTLIAWYLAGWYPRSFIKWKVAKPLFAFSGWVLLSGILSWALNYGDNALSGLIIGSKEMGVYVYGWNLSQLLPAALAGGLCSIAYPAFCRLQDKPNEVGKSVLHLQSLTAAVLFPMCLGISVVAIPAAHLLYGDRWPGLGQVMEILGALGILMHLWGYNAFAYQAIGRPDAWTKIATICVLILFPLLTVAGTKGVIAYTLMRCVGILPYPIINMVVSRRLLKISIRDQLKAIATPFLCTLFMCVLGYVAVVGLSPFDGEIGWIKLFAVILFCIVFYTGILWLTDRIIFQRLLVSVRKITANP